MPSLTLKPGREKSLLRRHPWIFSGALERVDGDPAPGESVDVLDAKDRFLARAAYSPSSQIRARVWTFDPDEPVDADFFRRRIRVAMAMRKTFFATERTERTENINENSANSVLSVATGFDNNACRLVHAESDRLPGLIVDRYGDTLVLQSLTAGCEFWRETIADILLEETGAGGIYE